MKRQICFSIFFRYLFSSLLLCSFFAIAAAAADTGTANLSEPLQKEKFFEPERLSITGATGNIKPLLEPQLSVSHDAREDELGLGVKQTTHRVHGEAGGKLNLFGDVSMTTVAKVPVYAHGIKGSTKTSEGETVSELLKNPGNLSWRSELGLPLKEGLNLNFFYDNSVLGRVDRPGVEERDEKFGTRFIFKFK